MTYSDLFNIVQNGECESDKLDGSICVKKLKKKAEQLSGNAITHIKLEMDISLVKGIYLPSTKKLHDIFGQGSANVILTSESLTPEWEGSFLQKSLCTVLIKKENATLIVFLCR